VTGNARPHSSSVQFRLLSNYLARSVKPPTKFINRTLSGHMAPPSDKARCSRQCWY
jgi:hypothetical protein